MPRTRSGLVAGALLLALAGCPAASPVLPDSCGDGEYLVAQGGGYACRPLPAYALTLPETGFYDTVTSDGHAITRVLRGPGISAADVGTVSGNLPALQQSADALLRGAARPRYVGVTKATTTGAITAAGADPGIAAAAVRCRQDFPGAHMCTAFELIDSVATGALTADGIVPLSWTYLPAWNQPLAAPMNPTEGLADNCAGYTYGLDDKGWAGTAAEWTVLATGFPGFKFHGGTGAPCSAQLPIACCK